MDLGGFMQTGWGHITEVSFESTNRVGELKKYVRGHTSGKLKGIVSYSNDTMTNSVKVSLVGGKTFCMGQIPSQCGWVVVGDYLGGKDTDFLAVVEISVLLAKLCTYGGLFINASTEEEETILKAQRFTCIYLNEVGSLFYKDTEVPFNEHEDEEYYDEEWEDY